MAAEENDDALLVREPANHMTISDVIGMLSAVQAPTKDRTDPSYLRPLTLTGSG